MVTLKRRQQFAKSLNRKGEGFVISLSDNGMSVLFTEGSTLSVDSIPKTFHGIPVTTGLYGA